MKRMKVLLGNRRMMVLLTLAILVLAATALVASSASFTATSANPGNMFTAGSLSIDNSKGNGAAESAILTATNMKPGDPATTGTVAIKNTGTVSGAFTLTKSLVGADTVAFGTELQMTVQEYTDNTYATPVTGPALYTGAASGAISAVSLGTWAPNATHYYKVSVNWPAVGGGPDNNYMGASVTYRFQWDATSL